MKRLFLILFKYLKWIISSLILFVSTYIIFAIIFSIIPVNRNVATNNEIDIYIKTNGVHLDIALPIRNEIKDWTTDVWIDNKITHIVNFISFGWGDKEFYMNTPEWSDLTLKTAFIATFLRSPSAIHIDYHTNLQINDKCKIISINKEQYKTIVNFIEQSFMRDSLGNTIQIQGFQTNTYDCYYNANNSYNLFFTCNTWTNKCLKESGLKACLWTPFDKGTLYHYRKNEPK
ncbi:MAG: TIGR02117 family protein [Bacteroidales bacterium]|nr:TIGR02117 family protein [Bacteroidales bacterium]